MYKYKYSTYILICQFQSTYSCTGWLWVPLRDVMTRPLVVARALHLSVWYFLHSQFVEPLFKSLLPQFLEYMWPSGSQSVQMGSKLLVPCLAECKNLAGIPTFWIFIIPAKKQVTMKVRIFALEQRRYKWGKKSWNLGNSILLFDQFCVKSF